MVNFNEMVKSIQYWIMNKYQVLQMHVGEWDWAGSVCTGLANKVTSLVNWQRTPLPSKRSLVRLSLPVLSATVTIVPEMGPPEGSNVCTCGIGVARGQQCLYTWYCGHISEQGGWKRLLDESDSCLSKGMGGRSCESAHGVDFQCCTATVWWSEPCRCCARCSRTNADLAGGNVAQWHWAGGVYWPCEGDHFFGELVKYVPAKWEVPDLTQPAGAVSHCYMQINFIDWILLQIFGLQSWSACHVTSSTQTHVTWIQL